MEAFTEAFTEAFSQAFTQAFVEVNNKLERIRKKKTSSEAFKKNKSHGSSLIASVKEKLLPRKIL